MASRPDVFVYAGVRDPSKASALGDLAKKYPGRIEIVECVAADAAGNAQLAKVIKEKHGRVDTVIANAGALHCRFRSSQNSLTYCFWLKPSLGLSTPF